MTVNQQAGSNIDFYNIRYFRQGNSVYNTATQLFNTSSGWASGTSVNELVAKGIDSFNEEEENEGENSSFQF